METKKSKVFAKRFASLFLALVMAFTCFSGVITAQAKLNDNRADNAASLSSNWVDWTETLGDDACEALLDAADELLKNLDLTNLAEGMLPMTETGMNIFGTVKADYSISLGQQVSTSNDKRGVYISAKVYGVLTTYVTISVTGYIDSVDGIIDLLNKVKSDLVDKADISILGTNLLETAAGSQVKNLKWDAITTNLATSKAASSKATSVCGKSWRANLSAKYIIQSLLKFFYDNVTYNSANNILYAALNGTLSLGLAESMGYVDIYGTEKGILGSLTPLWTDWQKNGNVVYNLVGSLLLNSGLFTDAEIKKYTPSSGKLNWDYDTILFQKACEAIVKYASFNVVYPDIVKYTDYDGTVSWIHDTAQYRYQRIQNYVKAGKTEAEAIAQVEADDNITIDRNIKYTDSGNVLLFDYAALPTFNVLKTNTLYEIVDKALPYLWLTILRPSIGLIQLNVNILESTDYDNYYFKWFTESDDRTWNYTNVDANYTEAYVNQWASEVYADYGAASADEFLETVKESLTFDRTAVDDADAHYNWRDIETDTLLQKVRYSPLADKVFNMQTGPVNLYFLQTGFSNIDAFMLSYPTAGYANVIEAINDFTIAVAKDVYPSTSNVGVSVKDDNGDTSVIDIDRPTFTTTKTWNSEILLANIIQGIEYLANTTDANILNGYYKMKSISADTAYATNALNIITGSDLETALVPLLINIAKLLEVADPIHNSDWDKVKDLQGLFVIGLKENLGFLFPDRDYSSLWTEAVAEVPNTDISYSYIVAKNSTLLEDAILPMARDAIGYYANAYSVPITKLDTNRTPWDPYTMSAFNETGDDSTIWALANSYLSYLFGDMSETFDKSGTNSKAKALGVLIGLSDSSGKSLIKSTNSLWTNIDLIVNRFFPAAGKAQLKGEGNFSSEDFVLRYCLEDFFTINYKDSLDGFYSTATIDSFTSKGVDKATYFDFFAPAVNGLFGKTAGNSASVQLLPTTDTASPVDRLLTSAVLVNAGSYQGLISHAISNVYQYMSAGKTVDNCYHGYAFLLSVIGLPIQFSRNELDGVKISIDDPVIYGTSATTRIKVRNNSYGLNRFFTNASDAQQKRSRYWVDLTSVKLLKADGTVVKTISSTTTSLAPEKYVFYNLSKQAVTADTLYRVEATYDVYYDDVLVNNNSKPSTKLYSNLKKSEWMYVAPSGMTEVHKSQESATFNLLTGSLNMKDGKYTGSVVEGTAVSNLKVVAGSLYFYNAGVTVPLYKVKLVNTSTSAAKTVNRWYMFPYTGFSYKLRANGNASTVAANVHQNLMFVGIDEKGNIYDTDGKVAYTWDQAKSLAWVMGYNTSTDENGETVFDNILVNTANASCPTNLQPGTPARGVTMTTVDSLEIAKDDSAEVQLLGVANTTPAKYQVGICAVSGTSKSVADNITLAFSGDQLLLKDVVDKYTNLIDDGTADDATKEAIYAAAKVALYKYCTSQNVDSYVNSDTLRANLEAAGSAVAQQRALPILASVGATLESMNQVDYTARKHTVMTYYGLKAQGLLTLTPTTTEVAEDDIVTPIALQAYNLINHYGEFTGLAGLANYYIAYALDMFGLNNVEFAYLSTAPQWKIDEFVRQYNLYTSYLTARPVTLDRIKAELVHATSPADDYDKTTTAIDTTKLTAAETTAERTYINADGEVETGDVSEYRYTYSKKQLKVDDNVKVYNITTTLPDDTEVKFGKIEGGELVNDGYTTDSWNAYVDALGEVITAINNDAIISDSYYATWHLIVAENNLKAEKADESGLTISGKITIATDLKGSTKADPADENGIVGIDILDEEGNVLATSEDDGSFTAEIPSGVTEVTIHRDNVTLDRTVTITATKSVDGVIIPVVICDYNGDTNVNAADKVTFNASFNKGDAKFNVYCDFNADTLVNNADKIVFSTFKGIGDNKKLAYTPIVIADAE